MDWTSRVLGQFPVGYNICRETERERKAGKRKIHKRI